jgi:hypothetical protein
MPMEAQMKRTARLLSIASTVAILSTSAALAQVPQSGGENAAAPTPADAGAPAAGAAPAAAVDTSSVVPGPLFDERKQLFAHLQEASARGIGTANYMMAFKGIEGQVSAGASAIQIKPRVEQINNALTEQLKRAQVLKTQRPLPPTSSQQTPEAAAAAGGGAPGDATAANKPAGGSIIGIELPDGLKDKLLNSDKAKEMLKKFGQ